VHERSEAGTGVADDGVERALGVLERSRREDGEVGLLVVRHGLTVENIASQEGSNEDSLSDRGVAQARTASRSIRRLPIDAALVSPLHRTQHTAALLLSGVDVPVRLEPLAVERSVGALAGLTQVEVAARYPSLGSQTVSGITYWSDPPEGELLEDVRDRADRLLAKIIAEHRGENVLLVTHGLLMLQLHGALRGKGLIESLEQPLDEVWNCALNAFRVSPDGVALEHELVQLCPVNDEFPFWEGEAPE
jgi:broad specificity phosphatase PhoE